MIELYKVKKYCGEDISLIENYEKAVNDTTQMYHCHHIWETMLGYTRQELIELDEYYGIPACNLIFLTREEHVRLHKKGKKLSEEHREKMSESKKGEKCFWYGKHFSEEHCKKLSESRKGKKHSEEHCKKISESLKGEKNYMFGKHHTEETKKKMSESSINNEKLSKPILQYTKNGEFVAEYPSINECQRETNIKASNISHVLHFRRQSAGGYIFKYKQI